MRELKSEFYGRLDMERRVIQFPVGLDEEGNLAVYEHPVEMLRTLEDARMLQANIYYWCRHGGR